MEKKNPFQKTLVVGPQKELGLEMKNFSWNPFISSLIHIFQALTIDIQIKYDNQGDVCLVGETRTGSAMGIQ